MPSTNPTLADPSATLGIERRFSSDRHPFKDVQWEKRDALIRGSGDKPVFEQRGVQFPASWSQTAVNITAQKYFRGQLGSDLREWSVKQLIGRVVEKIGEEGTRLGYFADDSEQRTFEHELAHILLHQMAAFNSPVWFNIGVRDENGNLIRQTPSACFILGVEDNMESIFEWNTTEGTIFRAGSGAGVNLSRIRGSMEPLSGGGTASGPVSFMRGADAWAGTIKSGGKTRRAAKMIVLDVDHPDILDFIQCKALEEDKIQALADAGFSVQIGTAEGDRTLASVQYQNANNSVRVTDEFMRAVENDEIWQCIARTTGEPIGEPMPAREIWEAIAEAAHRCADPGVQYDTTINNWHTCPNHSPIRGSNPCCLEGDTLVDTADGKVRIDELERRSSSGEPLPDVIAFEIETGAPAMRPISRAWVAGETAELVEVVTTKGLTLRCTPEHPFLTASGSYVRAEALAPGDDLRTLGGDGDPVANDTVLTVTRERSSDTTTVYDLEVPGLNNFTVTAEDAAHGVVVHNSEYMHVDDSSCNLASLNLQKFRCEDGTFDVESFEHAVRVMFTAQEILIGFGAYPTERIKRNTRAMRQIGLGYANLGAFLMADGLPYDSDEGRAKAAAITSLMTATSYHQSAVIAGRMGPYDEYEANKDTHLKVMRMHRAESRKVPRIDDDKRLSTAHKKMWEEAVKRGETNGYRNAQATVLAPTGCLAPESLVITDQGLARLDELGDTAGPRWQDIDFKVQTPDGAKNATKFYCNESENVVRAVTRHGHSITGTAQHRVRTIDMRTGDWQWTRLADLTHGDVLPIRLGGLIGEPRRVALPVTPEPYFAGLQDLRTPDEMSVDLAELVGYFMGDGSLHAKGLRFCVAPDDPDVADWLADTIQRLFGIQAGVARTGGYIEVTAHSTGLAAWWEAAGFSKIRPSGHTGKGLTPHVPAAVRAANDAEVYGAFLRGLWEADGGVYTTRSCVWTSASRSFSEEVRTLLLTVGVATSARVITESNGHKGTNPVWSLRVRNGYFIERYAESVGFHSERKREVLGDLLATFDMTNAKGRDYIPLTRGLLDELAPDNGDTRRRLLQCQKRNAVSRSRVIELYEATNDPRLAEMLQYVYEPVATCELGELMPTFDLSVPENVTYIANGIVSHNTISFLMDCDTTGVEPDFSLIKYKDLVGGGQIVIANQTVPEALRKLGYSPQQINDISAHIEQHNSVLAAPHLDDAHKPVFECAVGDQPISWLGHVKMMAACQPFISGAISKTVNMPNDATVQDISDAYMTAWTLGVKALAVYRDGSKTQQPLGDGKAIAAGSAEEDPYFHSELGDGLKRGVKRRIDKNPPSRAHQAVIGGLDLLINVHEFEDGTPGRVQVTMAQSGSTLRGMFDTWAVTLSEALRYGAPLEDLIEKLSLSRFEPNGFTDNQDIGSVKSIPDYVMKFLAINYLPPEHLAELLPNATAARIQAEQEAEGELTTTELPPATPVAELPAAKPSKPAKPDSGNGPKRTLRVIGMGVGTCDTCGGLARQSGACMVCENCGAQGGCG